MLSEREKIEQIESGKVFIHKQGGKIIESG
jgi:hypothetical protein